MLGMRKAVGGAAYGTKDLFQGGNLLGSGSVGSRTLPGNCAAAVLLLLLLLPTGVLWADLPRRMCMPMLEICGESL